MKVLIVMCLVSAATAFPGTLLSRAVEYEGAHSRGQTPLIVGGSEAPAHAYPYQISLQAKFFNSWFHICGGSIVGDDKIVTAAQCVYPHPADDLRVVAGEHDLSVTEGTEQVVMVKSFDYPDSYNPFRDDYDYAVVRLSSPLSLNSNVTTIELASSEPTSGSCVISGWGSLTGDGNVGIPDRLQHVTLPIVDRSSCSSIFSDVHSFTERMICAGGSGQGHCQFDMGGPLVCDGRLAGIASWVNYPCNQGGYPSAYANVAAGLSWLNAQ